jgi:hypothetical protein
VTVAEAEGAGLCTCRHAVEDHVVDMAAGEPTLACIAFHCDCRVASARLEKAS